MQIDPQVEILALSRLLQAGGWRIVTTKVQDNKVIAEVQKSLDQSLTPTQSTSPLTTSAQNS